MNRFFTPFCRIPFLFYLFDYFFHTHSWPFKSFHTDLLVTFNSWITIYVFLAPCWVSSSHWPMSPCQLVYSKNFFCHTLATLWHPNLNVYFTVLLGHFAILFNEPPKPGACWSGRSYRNYTRTSWVLRMTRIWTQDLSILSWALYHAIPIWVSGSFNISAYEWTNFRN